MARNIGQNRNKDSGLKAELRKDLSNISSLLATDSRLVAAVGNSKIAAEPADIAADDKLEADKLVDRLVAGKVVADIAVEQNFDELRLE